jgi:TRAP-type C4-dicarboxylate transport system substrate-binding protein
MSRLKMSRFNKSRLNLASRFAAIALLPTLAAPALAQALPPTTLNVVGSIGTLSMYTDREVPFWTQTVPKDSGGAIKVTVKPFTELGLKGGEIFRLVSSGTIQLSNNVLAYNSGEVPMNEATDLAGLVGTIDELKLALNAIRGNYAELLEKKYNVKLLGFGSYQAQVIYCRDAFTSIADLKGRKVRTSGASLQAFVTHFGGSPVNIAFAEVQPALATGVIDCGITGALSGYRSKWHEAAKFVSPMPINFGVTAHLANLTWWKTLDPKVQTFLETSLRKLEDEILDQAKLESETGINCNTGAGPCPDKPANMKLVPISDADVALRKDALAKAILPGFAQRCGADCIKLWNGTVGKALGIAIP